MALIMTQDKNEQFNPSHNEETQFIPRLCKEDLKNSSTIDYDVCHYTGPKDPPMPKNEAMESALSLKFLAHQAVSMYRAQECDFTFLKSIINNVNTPE